MTEGPHTRSHAPLTTVAFILAAIVLAVPAAPSPASPQDRPISTDAQRFFPKADLMKIGVYYYPEQWPECHYTSDPAQWPECEPQPELADLGDAPDSSNHAGTAMTAFPAGGPPGVGASYPTAFDPGTGLPTGPKHWRPLADAWLGPAVTLASELARLSNTNPRVLISRSPAGSA